MNLSKPLSRPWWTTAMKVAGVYIVTAGLWIAFSDQLLAHLSENAAELSRWQTAKGWFFVLATGGLLFVYLNRCLRRQYEAFNELTTLFDSIPAVVYVADMQSYDLLFVNRFACEQFGPHWQASKCYEYLQQGQMQSCGFCTNQQLLRDGQPGPPVIWEFRNTRNGRWYQCLDKAVRWPDGRLVRLEIALDITERKELERTKEELLSAVSHEMRTPLTAIAGFSELLLDEPTLAEPVRRHIETIFQEAEKMQELVQTFLDVRRMKTDRARIDYEALAARKLLELATSSNDFTSSHRLVIDCDEELAVYGNRRELLQVFRQLIANACRFSPRGARFSCAVVPRAAQSRSLLPIKGSASPSRSWSAFSNRFIDLISVIGAGSAGSDLAWPWCARSSTCTAAPSGWKAPRARGAGFW